MRPKHLKDYNHGKNGWVGGNPRWGKAHGNFRGSRCREKTLLLRVLKILTPAKE